MVILRMCCEGSTFELNRTRICREIMCSVTMNDAFSSLLVDSRIAIISE